MTTRTAALERGTDGLDAHLVVDRGGFRLDLRLAAAPGEVVALLGPNGAGKTTALRALAGLTPLTAGQLCLEGRELEDPARRLRIPPEARPVGVVFQDYLLFPHLTALDNVAFGPRCHGVPKAEARAQAADILARMGLEAHAGAKPRRLSGGQAQRVALARALAVRPRLLLLDEPLAALDARTRLDVRAGLRRHLAEFEAVAVLVTHDPLDAMVLADRLVVIEDGRVVQDGTPSEVSRRPVRTTSRASSASTCTRGAPRATPYGSTAVRPSPPPTTSTVRPSWPSRPPPSPSTATAPTPAPATPGAPRSPDWSRTATRSASPSPANCPCSPTSPPPPSPTSVSTRDAPSGPPSRPPRHTPIRPERMPP